MENEAKVPVIKGAVKSGAIIGLISILISLIVYLASPELFAVWWYGIGLIVLVIILVTVLGVKFRNANTGYLSFGQSFLYCWVTFVVAGLLGSIFSVLLYEVIDPDLAKFIVDKSIENTVEMMRGFGANEAALDAQMEQLENDMPANFEVGGIIKNFFIMVIVYGVISLITGLIVKKNEPIEDFV